MLSEIPKIKPEAQKRDHYDSISTETRRMLVKLTQEDGVSIRKASKALQIKYSTGKTLIQLYKKTGRIDRVKQQRAKTIEAKHQVRKIIQQVLANGNQAENNSDENCFKNQQDTDDVLQGKKVGGRNNQSDNDMDFTPDEQEFLAITQVSSLPNDQKIEIENGQANPALHSTTFKGQRQMGHRVAQPQGAMPLSKSTNANNMILCQNPSMNFSRMDFHQSPSADEINTSSTIFQMNKGNVEKNSKPLDNIQEQSNNCNVLKEVQAVNGDNQATSAASAPNSLQQMVTNQIMQKLLVSQNSGKWTDKNSLLKSIRTMIMNHKQMVSNKENAFPQMVDGADAEMKTPESNQDDNLRISEQTDNDLECKDLNDQKRSLHQLSSENAESNCEMTTQIELSKNNMVSPFQGNENTAKDTQSQFQSICRPQEEMSPKKSQIAGYSNQQVLNYLLDNFDKQDKQNEDSHDTVVTDKAAVGAAVVPPFKSANQLRIQPEVPDEKLKLQSKICQSEPTRMETGASPNQFQSAWDKQNSVNFDFQQYNEEAHAKTATGRQENKHRQLSRHETPMQKAESQAKQTEGTKRDGEDSEKAGQPLDDLSVKAQQTHGPSAFAQDGKQERLSQLKEYLSRQLKIQDQCKGDSLHQVIQKVEVGKLQQLLRQFNQSNPPKSAFSTPTNKAEYKQQSSLFQKAQSNGAQPEANSEKVKNQMKLVNDILHKISANKNLLQNQLLLKQSPNNKVGLLSKRSSTNQQKDENKFGAVQQIHQPIPKRQKITDSPGAQPAQLNSKRSSESRKDELNPDLLKQIVSKMSDMAHKQPEGCQPSTQNKFAQLLKSNQLLTQSKTGSDKSKLKLQAQSKSAPSSISMMLQMALQERQQQTGIQQGPAQGSMPLAGLNSGAQNQLKQRLIQMVQEKNQHIINQNQVPAGQKSIVTLDNINSIHSNVMKLQQQMQNSSGLKDGCPSNYPSIMQLMLNRTHGSQVNSNAQTSSSLNMDKLQDIIRNKQNKL